MYLQKYGKSKKFKNIRQTYNGITYDSKLEAKYAAELELKMKAHNEHERVKSWERQVKISINVAWSKGGKAILTDEDQLSIKNRGLRFFHICNYFIDFVVTYADDSIEYVEVKGMETDVWKMKWKLTEAIFNIMHPEIELKVIK